jgi:hypothetical protein
MSMDKRKSVGVGKVKQIKGKWQIVYGEIFQRKRLRNFMRSPGTVVLFPVVRSPFFHPTMIMI